MVLTKIVSLCFLTSAVVIFFNVLTGRHQELADEVSSMLHQSITRSTYEVHDPRVLEVRHEVRGLSLTYVSHISWRSFHNLAPHFAAQKDCVRKCHFKAGEHITKCGVPTF